ncbi:5-formyltetrahydrofolate cyclo-ligase [Pseudoruegeria sp. SHC-113]|uniref:5-formyltetrahydrofolate cyclo-ligase n=1 Tax=Pseudoruegeria sp. SHC-113 TaxID=2855439 RepID=UPI0021BB4E83|nr:5-formyltetrahydrofolate cyclo-ligase [Pseudoruegeria sp. SHC-113]MCT8161005.1 5-formyltetrahydrofolate cyclo-ligase [Pseudoruegeria sp. SHC-113]
MSADTLTEAKAAARKAAFARRKAAHGEGHDAAAQGFLAQALAPHAGKVLAGYMPIRTEVSPLPVMEAHTATAPVGVPVILGAGQPLSFRQWQPGCAMEEGAFGALIPADSPEITPEVLIVPLVAFDRHGGRLGYGGGFYDRTLQGLRARGPVVAIGYAYAAQEAEALPLEPTDQPLDAIVTDAGILRF